MATLCYAPHSNEQSKNLQCLERKPHQLFLCGSSILVELEFGVLVWTRRKTLRERREPKTNKRTYDTRPESNLDYIDGRRALSPLRHPCSPNTNVWSHLVCNFKAYSHASSRNVTYIIRQPDPPLLLTPTPNLTPVVTTTPYNGTIRGGLVLTFANWWRRLWFPGPQFSASCEEGQALSARRNWNVPTVQR